MTLPNRSRRLAALLVLLCGSPALAQTAPETTPPATQTPGEAPPPADPAAPSALPAATPLTMPSLPPPEGATPLPLEAALRRTADQSPTFLAQILQDRAADARADLSCAELWPTLVGSLTINRNDQGVSLGGQTVVSDTETSGRIRLGVTLFDGGTIPRCRAARISANAAEASRRALERDGLFIVAEAYVGVLATMRQLEITMAARDLRATELEATQIRFDASLALRSDVSRAALELSRAEQAVLDAEAAMADAMDSLARLLGDPAGTQYILEAPTLPRGQAPAERQAEIAARLEEEAADLRHDAVWWDFLPSADLAAVTNWGPTTFNNPDGFNWVLTLTFTWVAFDGGFRYANLDLTEIDESLAQLDRAEVARGERFEEARTGRRVELAQQQLTLLQASQELARQTYEDVTALRERGLATGLEQSVALSDWIGSQLQLTLAELEARLAELEAGYADGSLWPEGAASL